MEEPRFLIGDFVVVVHNQVEEDGCVVGIVKYQNEYYQYLIDFGNRTAWEYDKFVHVCDW